jgi:ferric-dicitrate binding protein FerR (iron transport regulator)
MNPFSRTSCSAMALAALAFLPFSRQGFAQEEDLHFNALDVRGNVTAYHDQIEETTRLHKNQVLEDGDWVTTGPESEVTLRLNGGAYVYLPSNSKVHISRLQAGDKGPICQLKLFKGRVLCQLDKAPLSPFEVQIGNILCRAHGTLFEVFQKKSEVHVVSFKGSVVASSHGVSKIAKGIQLLSFDHGKFRYKTHQLKNEEQGHLKEWKSQLAQIHKRIPRGSH